MMRLNSIENKEDNSDRLKSGIITAVIWSAILLFLFWYKIIEKTPPRHEVVTRMLINFGDNRNGNGTDEPAPQEGSLAGETTTVPIEEMVSDKKKTDVQNATPVVNTKATKDVGSEKIFTGNSDKKIVKTVAKTDEKKENSAKANAKNPSTTSQNAKSKQGGKSNAVANAKSGSGDGKGSQAIGNLIAGRGKNPGSQGSGQGIGNAGDPLGGDGNGDSKIGIDRKLTGFIPGTMGRGGAQPSHNCSASGTMVIAYTVDKSGNVTSAKRNSGISDPCAVSTTISWVKKYVKAEKASVSSTGTYSISF